MARVWGCPRGVIVAILSSSMTTFFSTNDFRGRADESLNTETAWNIGKAFAEWLPDDGNVVVVAEAVINQTTYHALVEGILLQGRNVVAGNGDQTVIVNAVADGKAVGGVLVSHDELQGIEIVTLYDSQGVVITSERGLGEISAMVEAGNFVPMPEKGTISPLS